MTHEVNYRNWQLSSGDHKALQQFVASASREGIVLYDPIVILQMDKEISEDDPVYPTYQSIRFDYANQNLSMEKQHWLSLINSTSKKSEDPRVAMILAFMGQRAGVQLNDIYEILRQNEFIKCGNYECIYEAINGKSHRDSSHEYIHGEINGDHHIRRDQIIHIGDEGVVEAVPLLNYYLENDQSLYIRDVCAWSLGNIGLIDGVDALVKNMRQREEKSDRENYQVRDFCARSLGTIYARYWGTINDKFQHVIRILTESLRDRRLNVRMACAFSLGEIGSAAASAVPELKCCIENTSNHPILQNECSLAIRKIVDQQRC